MSKVVSAFFELLRILILLVLIMLVLGGGERYLYSLLYGEPRYNWFMALGNFMLFFILYRNYFQFKGWYKSKDNRKLNKHTTRISIIIAVGLIVIPTIQKN